MNISTGVGKKFFDNKIKHIYSNHYSMLFTPERRTSAESSLTLFPYSGVVHSIF